MSQKIKKVKNKEEKEKAYKVQFKKFDIAIKNEFYLEAISIDYAICEDKLNSFLYLSGCTNLDLIVTKKYRKVLRKIWGLNGRKQFEIKKISSKRNYILKMLDWVKFDNLDFKEVTGSGKAYVALLKETIIKKIDINALKNTITNLASWCEIRNEIIHGLLNKNPDDLTQKLENCARDGFKIAKSLEEIVEKYEKNNNIRKQFKIQ